MSIAPSTRPLSDTARHICIPDGIVASGWDSVEAQCGRVFGVSFDQWQKDSGKLILAKRKGGLYAAAVGGAIISIPRQTGKTYLVAWMVFALCTLVPDLTVVWTAHRTRTSDETFEKMKAMALRPKVQPYIEGKPRVANGQQQIAFVNGSRILFGSREQGFGRGFDMVDVLVLDEGQILTESAMTDMVPATNAAPNGLVIIMGTPPRPKDPGEVFAARRQDALGGDSETLYIELSAERGAKIIDWKQIEVANPSFPHRTSKTAILRMQKLLGSDINFYREAYGIWDEIATGASRLVSADDWEAIQVDEAVDGIRSIGVAFNYAGDRVSVGVAAKSDESCHLELVDAQSGSVGAGVTQLVEWLAKRWRSLAEIRICGAAWASTLQQGLKDHGVPDALVKVSSSADYFAANTMLQEAVLARQVTAPKAPDEDALEASVAISDMEKRGKSGVWGWKATTPDGDETPMEAISQALFAARTTKRRPAGDPRADPVRTAGRRGGGRGRTTGGR